MASQVLLHYSRFTVGEQLFPLFLTCFAPFLPVSADLWGLHGGWERS